MLLGYLVHIFNLIHNRPKIRHRAEIECIEQVFPLIGGRVVVRNPNVDLCQVDTDVNADNADRLDLLRIPPVVITIRVVAMLLEGIFLTCRSDCHGPDDVLTVTERPVGLGNRC